MGIDKCPPLFLAHKSGTLEIVLGARHTWATPPSTPNNVNSVSSCRGIK
jgi:hypothetical protein